MLRLADFSCEKTKKNVSARKALRTQAHNEPIRHEMPGDIRAKGSNAKMAKKPGKSQNARERTERVCRVSYILNFDQPVRSTIIGDQPLFYMDFDERLEDELAALDMLEKELNLESGYLPEYSRSPEPCEESCQEALIRDFQINCDSILSREYSTLTDIGEVLKILETSRYAFSLLEFARGYDVSVRYCDEVDSAAYIRESGLIQINPRLSMEEQVLLAGRELRRVWQHRHGVLLNPLTFFPDQAVLVNRAQVADLTVSMVRIAWELQLGGFREAWERIENSPMSDFARIFAREAFLDFRTINNGMAMAATFETWFISERCRIEDKNLIQQMLSDYHGYVFDAEECSRAVTADLVARLGEVPFGKNYLAQYASTIIIDPLFTDVRDRANANFLWFIKFEKSFRETEQELQNGNGLTHHAFRHDQSENHTEEFANGSSQNVITFPGEGRNGQKDFIRHTGRRNAGNAQIIAFPRLAGED